MKKRNIDPSEKLLDERFWERVIDGCEVDKAIRDGARMDICDVFNSTPLHYAVRSCKSKEAIARLLDENPDIDARDKNGITPLLIAALISTPEIIELLLDKGADPKAQSNSGHGLFLHARNNERLKGNFLKKLKGLQRQ